MWILAFNQRKADRIQAKAQSHQEAEQKEMPVEREVYRHFYDVWWALPQTDQTRELREIEL